MSARFEIDEAGVSDLRRRWHLLTPPDDHSTAIFEQLRRAYSSRSRAYHNLSHVRALLDLRARFNAQITHPAAVDLAIWFHDAVYHTRRKDNEERSAVLANESLTALGVPASVIDVVVAMILATKAHALDGLAPNIAADGRLFLDFDLSILGSDDVTYRKYAAAIRREYWWVPAPLYRDGRRKVLESFLRRDRLYFTEAIFAEREARARANVASELAILA